MGWTTTPHITIQLVPHSEQFSSIGKQLLYAAKGGHTEHKKYTIREKFRVFGVKPSGMHTYITALL
jgi:hypothetical protein